MARLSRRAGTVAPLVGEEVGHAPEQCSADAALVDEVTLGGEQVTDLGAGRGGLVIDIEAGVG